MIDNNEEITLFTSNWCGHAKMVERFLTDYDISARVINIDEEPDARTALKALTGGHASVPTLLFPDGEKMTEPSMSELREKLGIEPESGLMERVWGFLSGGRA